MNGVYKIEYYIKIAGLIVFSNFMGLLLAMTQTKIINKYRLTVIKSTKILQKKLISIRQKRW